MGSRTDAGPVNLNGDDMGMSAVVNIFIAEPRRGKAIVEGPLLLYIGLLIFLSSISDLSEGFFSYMEPTRKNGAPNSLPFPAFKITGLDPRREFTKLSRPSLMEDTFGLETLLSPIGSGAKSVGCRFSPIYNRGFTLARCAKFSERSLGLSSGRWRGSDCDPYSLKVGAKSFPSSLMGASEKLLGIRSIDRGGGKNGPKIIFATCKY